MQLTVHQCLVLLGTISQLASLEDSSSNHRAKVESEMQAQRGIRNLINGTPKQW